MFSFATPCILSSCFKFIPVLIIRLVRINLLSPCLFCTWVHIQVLPYRPPGQTQESCLGKSVDQQFPKLRPSGTNNNAPIKVTYITCDCDVQFEFQQVLLIVSVCVMHQVAKCCISLDTCINKHSNRCVLLMKNSLQQINSQTFSSKIKMLF